MIRCFSDNPKLADDRVLNHLVPMKRLLAASGVGRDAVDGLGDIGQKLTLAPRLQ